MQRSSGCRRERGEQAADTATDVEVTARAGKEGQCSDSAIPEHAVRALVLPLEGALARVVFAAVEPIVEVHSVWVLRFGISSLGVEGLLRDHGYGRFA